MAIKIEKTYIILAGIGFASLLSAMLINMLVFSKFKKTSNSGIADTLASKFIINKITPNKSRLSTSALVSPVPIMPSISPSVSVSPSITPNPLANPAIGGFRPSPSVPGLPSPYASESMSPSPSLSILPSPSSSFEISVEVISSVPDSEIADFYYFINFSEPGFGISFKYHPLWVIDSNDNKNKLYFVDPDKVILLKSRIFSAFEDPDYQLGKYEIMQVNVFEPQGRDLEEWLYYVNANAGNNRSKLVYQQINGRNFLRLKDFENQVYYAGPANKIYSFWFKCSYYSNCSSENQERLYRKILETVN